MTAVLAVLAFFAFLGALCVNVFLFPDRNHLRLVAAAVVVSAVARRLDRRIDRRGDW